MTNSYTSTWLNSDVCPSCTRLWLACPALLMASAVPPWQHRILNSYCLLHHVLAVAGRSLADAYSLRATITHLHLSGSPDLSCMNLMCERRGEGCACRADLSLSRTAQLQHLEVANNKLHMLPHSLWKLQNLKMLDVSGARDNELFRFVLMLPNDSLVLCDAGNNIVVLPPDLYALKDLEVLNASNNKLTTFPSPPVSTELSTGTTTKSSALPSLKHLHLTGNPIARDSAAIEKLQHMFPAAQIYR
jgi:Leucine-rich repeat (LRR) protein